MITRFRFTGGIRRSMSAPLLTLSSLTSFTALHSSHKTSPTNSIVNLSEGSLSNGNGWGAEGPLISCAWCFFSDESKRWFIPTNSIVKLSEGSLSNGNGWGAEGPLVNIVPGISSLMNPSIDPSTPSATLPSRLETFSSTYCLGNISKVNFSSPSQLSTKAHWIPLLVAPLDTDHQ